MHTRFNLNQILKPWSNCSGQKVCIDLVNHMMYLPREQTTAELTGITLLHEMFVHKD